MKQIILLLFITSLSFSQFKFLKALPDPYYKFVVLGKNEKIDNIASDNWGCEIYNLFTNNTTAKFGNQSIQMNIQTSTGGSLGIPPNSYWNQKLILGNDFTIEFWVYNTTVSTSNLLSTGYQNGQGTITLFGRANNVTTFLFWSSDGIVQQHNQDYANTLPLNTWTHFCITRKYDSLYYFVDGKKMVALLVNYDIPKANGTSNVDNPIRFGNTTYNVSGDWNNPNVASTSVAILKGYIQAVKFSTIARYTSDFNLPTKPY